jgi:hypothetical protein
VDTKIISKLLAIRIDRCLEGIIGKEQHAFVSGRNIADGVRTIEYIFDQANQYNRQGALISVDFKKAFDSVGHEYLWETLKQFGFGCNLVHMVRTLYTKAESAILNEGISSRYFQLERSCRQGDCLSPYLFILAIEPLLISIRNNQQIKGIAFNNKTFKVSAYADDVTVMVADLDSIKETMVTLNSFGELTGLEINKLKSEIMGMGRWDSYKDLNAFGLKVVTDMKITGICICKDQDKQGELNFRPIVDKAKLMLNAWKSKNLSTLGKCVAVKAHAFSLLQFASSIISVPEWVAPEMNKLIYKFVWGGPDKVTRVCAALPVDEGGINLPMVNDVIMASQLQWFRKKHKSPDQDWAIFLDTDLGKLGGKCVLSGGMHNKTKLDTLLNFNQCLIKAWIHISNNPLNSDVVGLKKVSLWHNREIVNAKKLPMYFKRLNMAGINTVGDLFDKDNKIITDLKKHKINVHYFLEWRAICEAIPKAWKQAIQGATDGEDIIMKPLQVLQDEIGVHTTDEYIPISMLTQRKIKSIMSHNKVHIKNNFQKNMTDNLNVTDEEWRYLFKGINKWTISTRYRSFSWRLYNGVVFTNKSFCRFGYKVNSNCTFCDSPSQSREHLLLTCPVMDKFRRDIFIRFNNIFEDKIITNKLKLFGCLDCGPIKDINSESCDLIVMLLNMYIYYNNHRDEKLSQEGFINQIKSMERIEYAIAENKGKLALHLGKWEQISSGLGYNVLA